MDNGSHTVATIEVEPGQGIAHLAVIAFVPQLDFFNAKDKFVEDFLLVEDFYSLGIASSLI